MASFTNRFLFHLELPFPVTQLSAKLLDKSYTPGNTRPSCQQTDTVSFTHRSDPEHVYHVRKRAWPTVRHQLFTAQRQSEAHYVYSCHHSLALSRLELAVNEMTNSASSFCWCVCAIHLCLFLHWGSFL